MVLGVTDARPRRIVGSGAFSNLDRTKTGLFTRLRWRVDAEVIMTPEGRVLSFVVPGRPSGRPIHHGGRYLMRVGSSLVDMSPEKLSAIISERTTDYSAEIVSGADASLFGPAAVEEFRARWRRKGGNAEVARWSAQELLENAELTIDGQPTYAGLILLGTAKALSRHLAQSETIFEYRNAEASTPYQQREEFRRGFFTWFDELWTLVNLRNDVQQFREGLFKYDIPTFDEDSVREAILNAVCHRDYRDGGSIWIRQYPRLLEIESPGGLPDGITPENILIRQKPRNRRIAETLAKCGLVERSGQGMDLMFRHSIRQGKPLPDMSGSDSHRVLLSLRGEIGDPRFLRFLEQIGEEQLRHFSTDDFLAIDLIHRDVPLAERLKDRVKGLLDAGVIERSGRGKVILSRKFYTFLGEKGVHTRRKGLERETEKELLLKHLRSSEDGCAPMNEFLQVLPDRNRDHLKRLLEELRDAGKVHVIGSKRAARWCLGAGPDQTEVLGEES
jgi:ATP-dependent DNA helicase RecG